jgi:hypothetical protein
MKPLFLSLILSLAATVAQADLLTRWENAEEAILERQAALFQIEYGTSGTFEPWTTDVRAGKSCLLDAMVVKFGAGKIEGWISDLEGVAARRMSYERALDLGSDWTGASSRNQLWFEEVVPLAQACNSSF